MEGIQVLVTVLRGGELCFAIEVTRFPFTIGASPRCDVVLDDPYVSRRHAVVNLSRGQLHFTDSSSNGSFYRGQRITSQLVPSGDAVEVLPFELRFDYSLPQVEERRTALRDLGEILSPDLRERMQAGTPAHGAAAVAAPPTPRPDRSAAASEEVSGQVAPPPTGPVAGQEEPPPAATAQPEEASPEAPSPAEPAEIRCEPAVLFEPPTPSPPAAPGPPADLPAPAPAERPESLPEAAVAGPRPEPLPAAAESQPGPTEIAPPPPVVRPHRPAASLRRTAAPSSPPQPPEPPTIAFEAARPEPRPEVTEEPAADGTVHLPMEALMAGPRLWLQVVDGPPELVGKAFPLPDREVTVGRSEQADLRLDLANISRVHASLTPHGEEEWMLRDLASLNGTFVAGQRITQHALRPGQEFRLANAVALRLVQDDTAAPETG